MSRGYDAFDAAEVDAISVLVVAVVGVDAAGEAEQVIYEPVVPAIVAEIVGVGVGGEVGCRDVLA